jgi:hypothetical protein
LNTKELKPSFVTEGVEFVEDRFEILGVSSAPKMESH